MEIKSEKPVPAAEARNTMSKKKDEDLAYEQKICMDFLEKNVDINVTDARKAMKELQEVGRVKARQAAALINVMPQEKSDIRLIFSKERTSLSDENMEEILEILDQYRE
ncbi:MAG: RNA polymerase Rpb4 family protein [Candidatus Aenigmatarchaeota archaeon]